jgi:K+-transporting ATPase ATPase B chain
VQDKKSKKPGSTCSPARNVLIYGIGGIIVPFPRIWLIDQLLVLLHLA